MPISCIFWMCKTTGSIFLKPVDLNLCVRLNQLRDRRLPVELDCGLLLQPAAGPATRPTAAGLPIAGWNKLSSCCPCSRRAALCAAPAAATACPFGGGGGAEQLPSYHPSHEATWPLPAEVYMPSLIPLLLRPACKSKPASLPPNRPCYSACVDRVLAVSVVS